MGPRELREAVDLLKLSLRRVQKEVAGLKSSFCAIGKHCFAKSWKQTERNGPLFSVIGYVCMLCDLHCPLKTDGSRCPVCNETMDVYENIDVEDINSCSHCGFSSLNHCHVGIPNKNIPHGDVVEIE